MSTFLNPFSPIAHPYISRILSGHVYFGLPYTNPVNPTNQLPVKQFNDRGTLVNVHQPLTITNGIITDAKGNISQVEIEENSYAMSIFDSDGVQVYYSPNVLLADSHHHDSDEVNQLRTVGTPLYISDKDNPKNPGKPYPYTKGAVVRFPSPLGTYDTYQSLKNNNTAQPTDISSWAPYSYQDIVNANKPYPTPGPGIAAYDVGRLMWWGTTMVPDDWLVLDGRTITNGATSYPLLAKAGSPLATTSGSDIKLVNVTQFLLSIGGAGSNVGAIVKSQVKAHEHEISALYLRASDDMMDTTAVSLNDDTHGTHYFVHPQPIGSVKAQADEDNPHLGVTPHEVRIRHLLYI